MVHRSTKTFPYSLGLSVCYRQWRAESHCRFLHGYALEIRLEFDTDQVDEKYWVVDFGSFKGFRKWLEDKLDHKTLVAYDDPALATFEQLHTHGLIQMVKVPATGCEAVAEMIHDAVEVWLTDGGYKPRVQCSLVEVKEHAGNSGIYIPD